MSGSVEHTKYSNKENKMNKLETLTQLLKFLDCGEISGNCNSLLKVGQAYLIRTVTMAYTGKIEEIGEHEIRLSNACWIAGAQVSINALAVSCPISSRI